MSDKSRILLKSFSVESFGGIDASRPVILNLSDYKDKNITIASGDNATGKTSWVHALMYSLGKAFNIKESNFINLKDDKLKVLQEFEYDGKKYKVNATKSRFELLMSALVGNKEYWLPIGEPVATLQKLVGYIGTSPMAFKEKRGEDQVKEIRKSLNVSDEVEEKEKSLKDALKIATSSRTEANRQFTSMEKLLTADYMYINWEESEKKYKEKKTIDEAKDRVNAISQERDKFIAAKLNLSKIEGIHSSLSDRLAEMKDQLIRLQSAIKITEADLDATAEKIKKNHQFIEDNQHVEEKYNESQEEYRTIYGYLIEQTKWEAVKKTKEEMDEYAEMVTRLDAQKDDIKKQLLEVGNEGMPAIEGLRVVTTDAIDGPEVGVYQDGKNLSQLSETELWCLFLKIWDVMGVQFIFCENLQAIGSDGVAILNHLAAKGVRIFATEMKRGQDTMKIGFYERIQ